MIHWQQERMLTSQHLRCAWYGYETGTPRYLISVWHWSVPDRHQVSLMRIGGKEEVVRWCTSSDEADQIATTFRARPEEAFMEKVL